MSLLPLTEVSLCSDCLGFVAYGTLGDASSRTAPNIRQQAADTEHAELMRELLGVTPVMFDDSRDEDGGFSHSGCEGCGKRSCHVYTGTVLYESKENTS